MASLSLLSISLSVSMLLLLRLLPKCCSILLLHAASHILKNLVLTSNGTGILFSLRVSKSPYDMCSTSESGGASSSSNGWASTTLSSATRVAETSPRFSRRLRPQFVAVPVLPAELAYSCTPPKALNGA